MKKVTVKQDEKKPVPVEVMAASIVSISEGIKKLRASPLNDRALVLLIQHACPQVNYKPVSGKDVRAVLAGIEGLEREYLKPRKP